MMAEQFASEKLRFESFSSWTRLSATTRHQLALAGFVVRENEICSCLQCSAKISIDDIDENRQYSSNSFRQLHRKLSLQLNQSCAFLLCQTGTNIDDLHSSSTFDWNDAEYPEFYQLQTRLETFHRWPYLTYQNTFITPEHLAKRGFFFNGQSDAVTCFYCGNILRNWTSLLNCNNENIVQLEHVRFFPCRFILHLTGNNFIKEANYFQRVDDEERRSRNPIRIDEMTKKKPESIAECRLTFETWPENAPVTSEDLIRAGFFYLGESFRVQCHVCHLILDDFMFRASPLTLHRQRNPQCEFLQMIDSTKFGDAQCVEEQWRLETFNTNLFPIVATRQTIENLCQELAACGFYCSGRGQNIRCAYCGVSIQPNLDQSIMSQHRSLMKNSTTIECPLVRAQCPANRPISSRARFPETRKFETIFARRQSFENYQQRFPVSNEFIEERVYAGFFYENAKRMRCFQCGNALPIQSKRLQTDYPQYNTAKLHAYFYPTCEWVLEILGPKYIAQTIFDRKKSNRIESPFSSASISTLSETSPVISITNANFFDLSDYADDSDDDDYETVARPFSSRFVGLLSPSLSPAPSSDQSPPVSMQPTTDHHSSHTISPIIPPDTHPFRALALETSPPMSPSAVLIPVDFRQTLASEINRLETFRQHDRTEFARLSVEELAYAGFYLAAADKVKCPWCDVELTEKRFESILRRRPMLPGLPLSDDPWTAMRVHRHAVGQITDQNNGWCIWVRRQGENIYPNQMNPQSRMAYPEYPTYESVEKRIRSFQSSWPFGDGSRLSKQLTADAGFIHLGEDQVICFYCGNALREFKPRDCPLEEHAIASPLCDFIVQKLGESVIKEIVSQCDPMPQAKQRIEIRGNDIIKTILYTPSRLTPKKLNRKRVQRMISAPDHASPSIVSSSTTESRSISINEGFFEELCQLCCDQTGSHVYHPCRHYLMCSICVARLTDHERTKCFVCHRNSTISLK